MLVRKYAARSADNDYDSNAVVTGSSVRGHRKKYIDECADRRSNSPLSLASRLKLGGKLPPTRRALYDKYLSRKMGC